MHPVLPAFFHLLQTLLLFRGEDRRDLAMRLSDRFVDAAASVASNLFELRSCLFDDRRNLVHLFVGQPELPLQTVLHRLSGKTVTMRTEKEVMRRGRADENAGGAAGHKNEHETGDQFPFQRAIHCATSS
jgi:hypothetical protein